MSALRRHRQGRPNTIRYMDVQDVGYLFMFFGVLLHSQVDHGQGGDEAADEESPCRDEDVHVWDANSVRAPYSASCCRLQGLVYSTRSTIRRNGNTVKILTETSQVGELCGVIGHRAHDPVRSGLPHGVENTADDV